MRELLLCLLSYFQSSFVSADPLLGPILQKLKGEEVELTEEQELIYVGLAGGRVLHPSVTLIRRGLMKILATPSIFLVVLNELGYRPPLVRAGYLNHYYTGKVAPCGSDLHLAYVDLDKALSACNEEERKAIITIAQGYPSRNNPHLASAIIKTSRYLGGMRG